MLRKSGRILLPRKRKDVDHGGTENTKAKKEVSNKKRVACKEKKKNIKQIKRAV